MSHARLPTVLVHVHNEELVVVDLHHVAGEQVVRLKEVAGDLVQVDALLQEAPRDDAHVPLRRLVDRQRVILKLGYGKP